MAKELFSNILGADEVDTLFEDVETPAEKNDGTTENEETQEESNEETTEDVDEDSLFGDEKEQPESVGSDKSEGEKEDTTANSEGASPTNFYSTIANAMAVDGIFPNLDEKTVENVTDAETLSKAIEAEINARLDEKQQRVAKALENGVEANDVRNYENTLAYIDSIKEEAIAEESAEGEQLRYRLIYQDFLNKGYSQEKADKLTRRSIEAGTDVEDAKDAIISNKEFFQKGYNKILQDAQDKADAIKVKREKDAEQLKTSILKDKQLLGDFELSNDLRKKAFETIAKPVYKDPETGAYMTAIQKYQKEHNADFLKYVGLFMTLTNGFKDFDSFTKGKVKKEVKKGMRDLERVLSGSRKPSGGNMKMVSTMNDDDSFLGKGITLAL